MKVFKMSLWYQTACKTVDHRDGLFLKRAYRRWQGRGAISSEM